jgi:hypothetical protein
VPEPLDPESDHIRQIAQVYVDLMSIAEESLSHSEMAAALDLASQRATELGAISVHEEGETVTIDPTNLVIGGMVAMRALTKMIEDQTALSRESLLAAWREAIDGDSNPLS